MQHFNFFSKYFQEIQLKRKHEKIFLNKLNIILLYKVDVIEIKKFCTPQ